MRRGLLNRYRERYHIIDDGGNTTVCDKFSAWGTINPGWVGRSGITPEDERSRIDADFVDLDIADPCDSEMCAYCERWEDMQDCEECCGRVRKQPDFDSGKMVKKCEVCGHKNRDV